MKVFRKISLSCIAMACSAVLLGAAAMPASATVTYGDLNDDGTVSLSDLLMLGHFLRGEGVLENLDAADTNANYIIDTIDWEILNDFIVRKIDQLPYYTN